MPVAKGQKGVRQELHKFKQGTLHSGSKSGPLVTNRKQAVAIALVGGWPGEAQPQAQELLIA